MIGAEADARADRIAAAYGQAPLAVLINTANALIMAAVLLADGGGAPVLLWFGLVLAVGLARLALRAAWRRDSNAAAHASRWGLASAAGAAASGLLWGGGAALLWPQAPLLQLLWVFVLGGMCAGATALHYAHLPSALAFVLPAGLPVVIRFAAEGVPAGFAAAAMTLIFLAALTVISRRASTMFGELLRLRHEALHQAEKLDAMNARLRQEMADRRRAEAELRQSQKMEVLGQLTGGIAHDFNNLLMAVQGNLELLRKRFGHGEPAAVRLIDNAMAGAKQTLQPQPVALPEAVASIEGLLTRSLAPGQRLARRFAPDLPPALADPVQLELALMNLLLNARDAMPAGGTIEIAAEPRELAEPQDGLAPGRYVMLGVRDEGVGMDAATLARAIEPFFTTKGVGRGTGLGLAMVHGFAEQSGGRLRLESRPGSGTTAEIWLPRAEAPPPSAPTAPPPTERAVRPLSVLVVDDDPLVLASTAAMLEDLGHAPIEARSGAEALLWLDQGGRPDLVLTDFGMPVMTGGELALEIAQRRPGLPVLLATGYGEQPAIAASGLPRLSKPFDQAALATAMAGLLRATVIP
jgi:signal transduction histidine kinase/CheY-like chemotaxis protein